MIKIIADTTSCLSPEQAARAGVVYLPQIIVIGEETYRDDTEMNSRAFLKRQATSSILPKTAAPPPALYAPIFEEIAASGDTGIVITPSAKLSGTYRGATVAAQDLPNADIRVIDSNIVGSGLGSVVLQAAQWAAAGGSADTIVENIKEMCARERVYFMVDTLEYLRKGGRIGAAKALLGSLLQMKPILSLGDGQIEPFDSQRTHKRALARLKEVLIADCPRSASESHLSIMHGDAETVAQQCANEWGEALGIPAEQISIYDLTPAILVHSGPGVIGVSFFRAKA